MSARRVAVPVAKIQPTGQRELDDAQISLQKTANTLNSGPLSLPSLEKDDESFNNNVWCAANVDTSYTLKTVQHLCRFLSASFVCDAGLSKNTINYRRIDVLKISKINPGGVVIASAATDTKDMPASLPFQLKIVSPNETKFEPESVIKVIFRGFGASPAIDSGHFTFYFQKI